MSRAMSNLQKVGHWKSGIWFNLEMVPLLQRALQADRSGSMAWWDISNSRRTGGPNHGQHELRKRRRRPL